jgi:hypothetical protein
MISPSKGGVDLKEALTVLSAPIDGDAALRDFDPFRVQTR